MSHGQTPHTIDPNVWPTFPGQGLVRFEICEYRPSLEDTTIGPYIPTPSAHYIGLIYGQYIIIHR